MRDGEVPEAGFSPAWWVRGPHLQTMWGTLARPRRAVPFRREALTTPDGDTLILDHVEGPAGSPRVLLLHGLEGSSYSVYIQGLADALRGRGWRAVALNFRSCARDPGDLSRMLPNERPRLYHSGETKDLDFVVRTLAAREESPLYAAGISLGGNVLLKWLGENPGDTLLRAAATISVPYDLAAGARHLDKGIGLFYAEVFLRTLRPKALDIAARFPGHGARMDLDRVRRSRTFWEFDDAATGPFHGFANAADYYARSSSLAYLPRITTPTLCISSEDDPLVPAEILPRVRGAVPPAVTLLVTRAGGHVGFVSSGSLLSPSFWAEHLVTDWLVDRI